MDHGRQLGHFFFPSRLIILCGIARQRCQDGAVRLLFPPECKAELVLRQQAELCPFHRARNCGTRDLLPIAACLLIAHQEILVVDARQVKVQFASVQAAGPDQTRVAERSIGNNNRQSVQPVVHYMVIPHLADRVSPALSP